MFLMTGGKNGKRILAAWPTCSHSEWLKLYCDTLWKPWMCAESNQFPAICPCCFAAWKQCSQLNFCFVLFYVKAVCVHCGRGECADRELSSSSWWLKRQRSPVAARCQVAASFLHFLHLYTLIASVEQPQNLIVPFWINWSQNHVTLWMNLQSSASSTQWQPGFGPVCKYTFKVINR